jgi:hypothetical protein
VTNTRTSGKVAEREVEQEERDLRSQPQSQKDCEHIRVDGIQGREGEMVAEQHRRDPSPSAITIDSTPLDSSSTSTVIGRTQTQMGMNSSGTGQEVPGTTRPRSYASGSDPARPRKRFTSATLAFESTFTDPSFADLPRSLTESIADLCNCWDDVSLSAGAGGSRSGRADCKSFLRARSKAEGSRFGGASFSSA